MTSLRMAVLALIVASSCACGRDDTFTTPTGLADLDVSGVVHAASGPTATATPSPTPVETPIPQPPKRRRR